MSVRKPDYSLPQQPALVDRSQRPLTPEDATPACAQSAPSGGSRFITVQDGNAQWKIQADAAESLLPRLRTAIERPEHGRNIDIVKTGPHRTVYRLGLSGEDFYLKHFRDVHWKGLLLNQLRPTKAENEWRAALRIAELGLPTFEPVALGIIRRRGLIADSFLVSRGIPCAIPLDEFVTLTLLEAADSQPANRTSAGQQDLRRALAGAIGKLCARMHLAGVEHADFHAANILVRLEPDGRPRLWLIDLHRVHFRDELSAERRHRNLAFLHQFFACKSTRADRLRFYQAYDQTWREGGAERWDSSGCVVASRFSGGGGHSPPYEICQQPFLVPMPDVTTRRAEIAALEQCLAEQAQRGWQRADRAWRRGNRHVKKLDGDAGCCRGLAALDRLWLQGLREDPERLFREHRPVWHKQTVKHRVAEIQLANALLAPTGTAFLKATERRGLWRTWLARFRDSPARKAWEFGHALLRRQIDTPRPILCVERRTGVPQKFYLLTEAVPETATATQFLEQQWPALSDDQRGAWLRSHGRRLAVQIRRLHESGFDHRDLKFSNLLVSTHWNDWRIWFLDLEGMRFWRRVPENRLIQNLARVNVSAQAHAIGSNSDRLRFLRWYLGAHFANGWKPWWRRIVESSQRKLETNKRRGRPVH